MGVAGHIMEQVLNAAKRDPKLGTDEHQGTNLNATIEMWLQRLGATHKVKKANMFTKGEVARFVREAPEEMLTHKLVLLVGVLHWP